MKRFFSYAMFAAAALAAAACSDDDTDSFGDKGWSDLTTPVMSVSADEATLDAGRTGEEALRFEWTSADPDGKAAVAYDLYMNLRGEDIFAGYKHEAGGELSFAFTHGELNALLTSRFGARSGERLEFEACVYARTDNYLVAEKCSEPVAFAVTAFAAEVVLPETLYMKGGACEYGWDAAIELPSTGKGTYGAENVVLKFGKPEDNNGFKFYVEPDGSYPFYGQKADEEFGEIAVFASENDGDSQFYPLQHGHTSGIYTLTVDLAAMRLTMERTGDVDEFDPDAVLYILGDGMEHGWDMTEENALAPAGGNSYRIENIRLRTGSSFKFYRHDWTEYIRDAAAADYWTLKLKGAEDGDMRFIPGEQGLGDGYYTITVNLDAMTVLVSQSGTAASYPERLYLFGPATAAGWNLGSFIPMERISDGIFRAAGVSVDVGSANPDDPKGNGFKFGVSNTEWSTEYGAAGSFDNGYLGWEIVQGSDQFYPLMMGLESGQYDITADLTAGRVLLEPSAGDDYPERLYILGDAMPCGWDLGAAVAMTRTAPGIFTAESVPVNVGAAQEGNPKGNGFKFIVSNTEWGTEYGAAGSFDNGYLGWELVQGSDQFYPLMMGFGSGNYRITADMTTMTVRFESM